MLGVSIVQRQFNKTELLGSAVHSFAVDADLPGLLKELAPAWAGSHIVASLPGVNCSQRSLMMPFFDRKRIEKALPFEIEDNLPFPLDGMVLDHLVLGTGGNKKDGETPVLAVMTPKTVLKKHLDLFVGAGIDPQAIVPSYAGIAALARMVPTTGCVLLICGTDVCFKSGDAIRSVRSVFPGDGAGGLLHTLRAFETEHKENADKVIILGPAALTPETLASVDIPVEEFTPELGGKKAADAGSLGIALSADINLRTGEFAYHLVDKGQRGKQRALIIAGIIAVLLFGVNIGVKFTIVRSGYGKLDKEIKEIYRQTFPDAPPAADPVRQMRDKMNEAKKRYGVLGTGVSALDIMKAVTDGIPKEVQMSFQEFNLEGDRLKLQGEGTSFESVDKIKAELSKSPFFADILVQDVRIGVENKVKFRMELKLKQGM